MRLTRVGAGIALALDGILVVRVVAIANPFALVVLAPSIAGGVVGLRWPGSRTAEWASAALILVTTAVSLIGYWGLAFVPSIVLLIAAATRHGRDGVARRDPPDGDGPQARGRHMMFTIVQADEDAWRRFREIRLRALEDTPSAFGSTLAEEEAQPESHWRERLANPDGAVFAALDADRWVGIAGVYAKDPSTAHLVSMWVDPTARRQGLGRLLVEAVVHWSHEHGMAKVDLWVTETNGSAIRLYTSCGFTRGTERQPFPSNPELSEFAMHRDLG